ncbi:MAG TPA: bifunctional glutamate N-acetyltransferase/amino-acid acetyltransferase ArgJ [Firmicutes bacterium]|nr:bifunctional glutamate N-acetyltransferase/amino-acid acetyltransferase ArgJ [Bacillota bacterium]
MSITYIEGGVCTPAGFSAAGVHCGIRKNRSKRDLALIAADRDCAAAAVYTRNLVKGAPLAVTKRNLNDGRARAVICNSGNANTCNADGEEKAWQMCEIAAGLLDIRPEDVIVASTGVIGQILPIEPIQSAAADLKAALSPAGGDDAAEAILTTDTVKKQGAVEFQAGGKTCRIGAMVKGSGMIHPNMATMLCFVTSDAAISSEALQQALTAAVDVTFNMVSIDGDTSTNDMVSILASGAAGNAEITPGSEDLLVFTEALTGLLRDLARKVAGDGEGATHLIECRVTGASSKETARTVAKSIVCSSLTKAAIFGADANWGRVLCAIGYAGVPVDVTKVDVAFRSAKGTIPVCKDGAGIPFDEDVAKEILLEKEVGIEVELNSGDFSATAWGCDLTYDYVKINGDYRT